MSETKDKIDNGGPAFPFHWHPEMGYGPQNTPEGMSLRDYFAAKAMQAFIYARAGAFLGRDFPYDDCAKHSLAAADAMIAARNKQLAEPTLAPKGT